MFKLLEEPDPKAILPKPENGSHRLGHGIVEVEDNLSTEDLRHQGTEHKDIGHVVDMHKVIPSFPRAAGKDRTGKQNERPILTVFRRGDASRERG
jgi:hypothetical protein